MRQPSPMLKSNCCFADKMNCDVWSDADDEDCVEEYICECNEPSSKGEGKYICGV